jgi:hypothetical protein
MDATALGWECNMKKISLGLVVGAVWGLLGVHETQAQDPAAEVRISVERSAVALGEPFWVDVIVRRDQPGKPQGNQSPTIELPADSPFELVRHAQAQLAAHAEIGPKSSAHVVQEHRVRWIVRANQLGQHPIIVHINGKPSQAASPFVSVLPQRRPQAHLNH